MADDSIFLGLITHQGSKYASSARSQLADLALASESIGLRVETLVSDRDDLDRESFVLDARAVRASADYQTDLEFRWRRYLAAAGGGSSGLRDVLLRTAMRIRRRQRTDAETLRRLLNIDLSHLRVLEAAGASGASWALVLEDDAWAVDREAAVEAVREVCAAMAGLDAQYAVVSESIHPEKLGIVRLLEPLPRPNLEGRLLRAVRPVTNTVCATLYRSAFAARLGRRIAEAGLMPVAPIDWRVNEALMGMAGDLGANACLVVRPGIFVQRSMHG